MTWRKITCEEREALVDELGRSYNGLASPEFCVLAGRTDLSGEFGPPQIFTEWGRREGEVPVLRDVRWPPEPVGGESIVDAAMRPDAKPCEHYRYEEDN